MCADSERRNWWTLLEFTCDPAGGMLLTLSLVQWAATPRDAAEQSAGFQLGEGCRPRRILVYPEPPHVFECQIRPYILEVGQEITYG